MDTHRVIIDAAERLIRAKGVARVTTKDIAREAGCAEGSIFNHFDGKDDLLIAVVLERLPQFRAALPASEEGGTIDHLARTTIAANRFFDSVLPMAVALFADTTLLARHRKAMRDRKGGPHNMLRSVGKTIEEKQARGEIKRDVDPMSAAALLLGASFLWVFIMSANGKPLLPGISEKKFVDDVVATLFRGLAPAPRRARRSTKR